MPPLAMLLLRLRARLIFTIFIDTFSFAFDYFAMRAVCHKY